MSKSGWINRYAVRVLQWMKAGGPCSSCSEIAFFLDVQRLGYILHTYMNLDHRRLSAWLLSALILFGQTAALAHQSGHDVLAPHEYCAQCLTQSAFDGKALVAVHTYTILLADAALQGPAESRYHSHHALSSRSRSPPISPA